MSARRAGAGSGHVEGHTHVFPVRVYFEDTDAAGIVYYANYLKFSERARTEMLRVLGHPHAKLMEGEAGLAFAVRHCAADFKKPARLDDLLEVRSEILEVGGASLVADQGIYKDGELLVHVKVRLACIDKSARPGRIPADLRVLLQNFSRKKA